MRELANKDGFIEVHQPSELKAILAAAGRDGSFRVLYTPLKGKEVDHFIAVCKLAAQRKNLILAMDEVDKNQQPGFCPEGLYEIVNYGRHYQIATIGTSRRPAQVSKEYTYALSEICAFRVTEPGDLKYFESKCGSAAMEELPSLGKYAYLRWTDNGEFHVGKGWK